ncbi:MAG: CBS domain-containing protein, partial [Bacteroidota bacterium]
LRKLKKRFKTDKSLVLLTKSMVQNQSKDLPIHLWKDIDVDHITSKPKLVKEVMTSYVLKLYEDDYLSMARAIMEWNQIHHIPVEDKSSKLVGLLTWSYMASFDETKIDFERTTVAQFMIKDIITISPDEKISDARSIMERHNIGCLPVVLDKTLVGILSKTDLY